MMNKELIYVIGQMATEKGIDKEVLFEALESALLSASKKTMGVADNARMELDRHTGALRVFARKKVVESVGDAKLEIALSEARKLNAEADLEDEIEVELPPQEFGRIAAQTAKQVILQRVRDAERDAVYSDFIDKQGKIIRGTVHRIEKRNVIVDLGKAEAVITEREQIPGERYNPNDRVRAYVQEVKKTAKGPQILLSRADAGFLVRLFEAEIPEIAEGIVQVKAAAREPGERGEADRASRRHQERGRGGGRAAASRRGARLGAGCPRRVPGPGPSDGRAPFRARSVLAGTHRARRLRGPRGDTWARRKEGGRRSRGCRRLDHAASSRRARARGPAGEHGRCPGGRGRVSTSRGRDSPRG